MARINTRYVSGSGDSGYSHILGKLNGDRINYIELRKDDPACFIYGDCQELSLLIDDIFLEGKLSSPKLAEELEYLRENSYCISGFCFLLGNSPKNVFPDEYLQRLDSLIAEYNSKLENAPDFVQKRTNRLIIRLNQLTEVVRKMERHFVTWQYHPEVVRNLYETIANNPDESVKLGENIIYMLAILNRLSKFLFAAARHENMMMGIPESYWASKVV